MESDWLFAGELSADTAEEYGPSPMGMKELLFVLQLEKRIMGAFSLAVN